MTADGGVQPPRPGDGNLWDGDADTDGLNYLLWLHRAFSNFVTEHVRFVQEDPHAGKNANTEAMIARELVFLGERMQHHARVRHELMLEFGVPVLEYLRGLKGDKRAEAPEVACELGAGVMGIECVLVDLARSGAASAYRPRVGTLGRSTSYAITDKGRILLVRPQVAPTPLRPAIGGNNDHQRG